MAELKQSEKNSFTLVGYLKSKEMQRQVADDGKEYISGHVTVEYTVGDKLNNIRLDVYANKITKAGKESSQYKGFETVMDEYKDKDTFPEEADLIKVRGDINFNIFKTSNGNIVKTNRFRVSNFTRTVDKAKDKEGFVGTVTATILGYSPEMKDDAPTGFTKVKAYTVGYGGRVSPLVDLKVKDELGMDTQVSEHSTINISYHYYNYVIVEKKQQDEGSLFGNYEDVAQTNTYETAMFITGAKNISNPDNEPTEEEISEALKAIRRQEQEVEKQDDDKTTTGFSGVTKKPAKKAPAQPAFSTANADPFADSDGGISEDDF